MTLSEQSAWVANSDNLAKVRQALCKAAVDVLAETKDTAHHAQRAAYAYQVICGPDAAAAPYVFAVAANPGLTMTPSDNDLQFTVNSLFNDFAGVQA